MTNRDHYIAPEARLILETLPNGTKDEWGKALYDRLTSVGDPAFMWWLERAQIEACVRVVEREKRHAEESRLVISHDGRAVSVGAHLSVRSTDADGNTTRQLKLWRYCTPQEFLDAVDAEQGVIDGRARANEARMEIAKMLRRRPDLLHHLTVEDAVLAAGLDPDAFCLDDMVDAL